MRIRIANKKTGRPYRYVEPLFYVPWLYRCITMFGKVEYTAQANLIRR